MFRAFMDRFEQRHKLTRPQVVTSMAIRLGRTPTMVYHWLSQSTGERSRAIPFASLDLLHLEEILAVDRIPIGHDVLACYENRNDLTPIQIGSEEELASRVPRPFQSAVHTSDEERRLLFRGFMARFERRHKLTRPQVVTSIAIRLGRTPTMVYHWLSQSTGERSRAIPFASLDLLHLEEIISVDRIPVSHDVLAAYENRADLSPIPNVKGLGD